MKKILSKIVVALLPSLAIAAPPKKSDADLIDKYFTAKSPTLTSSEKAGLAITQKWQNAGEYAGPLPGPDGAVRYLFGASQPTIVCAVMKVCDVELQPGEEVISLNLGDPRFTIDPGITASADGEIQHLIIRPQDVGLETTLVVGTNRRTYRMKLISTRSEYMAAVVFTYPEDAMKKWAALRAKNESARQEKIIPETGEFMGDLDFHYSVSGNAPWKPLRVYNDGRRTIIQMPSGMKKNEAPALLVVKSGVFTDSDPGFVNYRLQGDRYIVDSVFEKAILVAGIGSDQDKITITKDKP
ncbi:P-type conjugative transfer protein TrbG [Pseudoduganella ginsengisoli]|uniref:P-type conjugative transfer protein TrbG n=1 Tax=Pseudoduganella ginsengisoli TaxID=1462440 RepID=A0A6L6Q7U3_9BURK|nr:P-type conjugative transfer protein TrbG [Pseudoduganella ginsengisoli]MTW05903.1 P-type conjugative transfer protein TrbG [Pseudoduganella ginsengisoli]